MQMVRFDMAENLYRKIINHYNFFDKLEESSVKLEDRNISKIKRNQDKEYIHLYTYNLSIFCYVVLISEVGRVWG